MPSIARCLRDSKLSQGVKSYLENQARDTTAKQAVSDYLAIVEGNIKSLTEARKAAAAAPVQEPARAQAIPSPQEEARIDEGRQDIRGQGQDREGAQPTGQEPEAQVERDGGRTTSARKVDVTKDRVDILGNDGLPSPERVTWQENLNEAQRQGIPDDALGLAEEIIAKPRAFSATETAGIVIRAANLKNLHAELTDQIGESTDTADIASLSTKANRVEQEFDILTEALRKSGTEKGRALAAQKLTINQDFRLISVLNRAKTKKGKALTTKEKSFFDETIKQLEAENAALRKKLALFNERRSGAGIKKNKNLAPKNRFAREARIEKLYAETRALLRAGCHNN